MPTIWTVGHSNRDWESFYPLLEAAEIELLADVRRFPGSRRHPHSGAAALREALAEHGVAYRHFEALGGRRRRGDDPSPNGAWRVESFNAYADYMARPEFQRALAELMELAQSRRTAIMCSEALQWRCHRRLIADALLARGWQVLDIFAPTQIKSHPLTPFARVRDGQVTYPAETLFD
jgi:uncharacterized protein (DUF488 family)